MTKPLTPDEVDDNPDVPDFVIEAVNKLLRQRFRNGSCTLKQKDIVEEILNAFPEGGITEGELYKKHCLDFEIVYRNAGWKVDYDKPGYNESYDATFTFTRSRVY